MRSARLNTALEYQKIVLMGKNNPKLRIEKENLKIGNYEKIGLENVFWENKRNLLTLITKRTVTKYLTSLCLISEVIQKSRDIEIITTEIQCKIVPFYFIAICSHFSVVLHNIGWKFIRCQKLDHVKIVINWCNYWITSKYFWNVWCCPLFHFFLLIFYFILLRFIVCID